MKLNEVTDRLVVTMCAGLAPAAAFWLVPPTLTGLQGLFDWQQRADLLTPRARTDTMRLLFARQDHLGILCHVMDCSGSIKI